MADKHQLKAEWEAFAREWIARCEERRDEAREGILDDWMLELAGDVSGKRVIDLGCGEGRFCRMLAARGAEVLGVDLQPAFIEYAEAHKGEREKYLLGDMEELEGVPDAAFDLAVSYISLVDVPDMRSAVMQAARVLKPGGRLLVSNLSPLATAAVTTNWWVRDEQGRKLHYRLDNYSEEGARVVSFGPGHRLTNYHRTFSTTINAFIDAGLIVKRVYEPTPNAEQLKRRPGLDDLFRAAIFIVYELIKPAT
ncbi:MAG: class I SAM-dependent methyltransferase [Planctomycetes bacterium]|nr:class I SAM-dependent methyltransferase [Planctomycetota bacterium]